MTDFAGLGIKIDAADAEVAKKVLDKLMGSAEGTASSADLLMTSFKKLMAVAGPAALGAAFASAMNSAIQLQDQYVRLSEVAGTTASMMSAMDLPARLSGTSLDAVATSIGRLGKSIGEARLGDVQKQGLFKALGIDYNDGRDAAAVMVDVAKAVSSMSDQTVAATVTQGLLQRGFSELRPFLKEITEQGELHARVTDAQAAAAKKFEDDLTKLKFNLEEGKIALANEYLPALTKVVDEMARGAKEGGLFAAVVKGLQTLMTGDDLHKANVELSELADEQTEIMDRMDVLRRQMRERPAMAPANTAHLVGLQRELDAVNEKIKTTLAYKKQLDAPLALGGKVSGNPNADGMNEQAIAGIIAEEKVRKMMEFNKTYEAQVAKAKAISDKYNADTKTFNAFLAEEFKQGNVTLAEYVFEQGRLEDARLKVMIDSLEKQRALHKQKGDLGKAEEAAQAIAQANAAIVANQTITNAKLAGLNQKATDDYRMGIATRYGAMLQAQKTEREVLEDSYASRNQLIDDAEREGFIDFEQWQAQKNLALEYYNQEKLRIEDEDTKQRFGIQKVYHEVSLDSAGAYFGYMSNLMQSNSRKMFEIGKAAAIGETVINTYRAAMGAWAALSTISIVGPALGASAAAAIIVAGLARVQQIRATQFGGGSISSTGTYSANPTTGLPTAPAAQAPQQQSKQSTIVNFFGTQEERKLVRRWTKMLNDNSVDGGNVIIAD